MLKFKNQSSDKKDTDTSKRGKEETDRPASDTKTHRSHSPKRDSSPRRRDYSPRRRDRSPKRDYSPRRRDRSPRRRDRSPRRDYSPRRRDRSPRKDERRSSRKSRSPVERRSTTVEKAEKNAGVKKVLKAAPSYSLIELEVNDRLGKKVRVKCAPNDLVGDFKKLVAAQIGTDPSKIVLKKWYKEYKDHITLSDYELHDGMNIELYYR